MPSDGITSESRVRTVGVLLVLTVLAAIPYLFALRYDFVYDDEGQILENAFLRNPARLKDVLLLRTLSDDTVINGRRPVVLVTYFLDGALWGHDPAGWHATNLIFHIGTMWILFFLVRHLAQEAGGRGTGTLFAAAAALLFGLHPTLIEAVHMPAFRPDILYSFFVVVYVLAGLRLREAVGVAKVATTVGAVAALLLALGAKEAGVIAPLVLGGIWLCFPSTRPRRLTMAGMLVLSTALVLGFTMLCARGASFQAATGTWNGLSLRHPQNLLTLPWLWLRYLLLLLWPYPLIVDRVVDPVVAAASPRFLAGAVVLAASVVAVLVLRRKRPWPALAVGWMLAGFLPVSNLVPLFNPMAERYMYFMAAGFAILAAWLLVSPGFGVGRTVVLRQAILGTLCAGYLSLSMVRVQDWRDGRTLWRATAAAEPHSARAHVWIGLDLKQQGRTDEAEAHLLEADRLNPQDITALVNLAVIQGQVRQDLKKAEELLREAVRRHPAKSSAHWNLAVTLRLQGRVEEALLEVEETLHLDPMQLDALRGRMLLLEEMGQPEEALDAAQAVLAVDPHDEEAKARRDALRKQLGIAEPDA